jgi:small redox-active disulfide protein 2
MVRIQVLSMACPECDQVLENAREAVTELKIEAEIELVDKPGEIRSLGVYVTPAIAVNGEIKVAGRVPSVAEIKSYLQD